MRPAPFHPRRRAGFALWPWLLILFMITSIVLLLRYAHQNLAQANQCRAQMKHIYGALGLYEVENGWLPDLLYYPDRPRESPKSLVVALVEKYGLNESDCVCPKAHPLIKEKGLSYIWNVNLNHQALVSGSQAEWMLGEIQMLSTKLAGPHFRNYHIVYTDGHVKRVDSAPHEIPGAH